MNETARRAPEGAPREGGQAIVELALILPILLLLLMGTVDVGRIFFTYIALEDAVQEGVMYASIKPDDVAGIRARVRESSNQPEVQSASVPDAVCATPSPSAAGTVAVTATADVDFLTPVGEAFFGPTYSVSSTLIGTNLKGSC